MFITLTIDTRVKNNAQKIRMHRRTLSPTKGWRKPFQLKKRSLIKKFKDWRKTLREVHYKLNGRTVML